MKTKFRFFLAFMLCSICFSSCNEEQIKQASEKDAVTKSVTSSSKVVTVNGNLTVSPDKLIYQPGNVIKFTGKVTNTLGAVVVGGQIGIDNPILQLCTIGPKTDITGKFVYSVNIPSTAKGIYAFVFYYGSSKSFIAIAVSPTSGLRLTNNAYSIPLGTSTFASSFENASLIKALNNSGFSIATQSQLSNTTNQIATFMLEAGRNSIKDYFSNPATQVITIAAITCTGTAILVGGVGVVACTPLYQAVAVEAGKSILIASAKTAINMSQLSTTDKTYWKNKIDIGNCVLGAVSLNPASSAINAVDAFGAGWTCGSAIASVSSDSKNIKSLKITTLPSASSLKKNVGAFVILSR